MALFIATAYDLLRNGKYRTFWDMGYRPFIRHHVYHDLDKTPKEFWKHYDRRFDSEISHEKASLLETQRYLDEWMLRSRNEIKKKPMNVGHVKIHSTILMLPFYVGYGLSNNEIVSIP